MADFMTTYSKINFTPLEPKKDQILIEDISHALSMITRANGHFREFYSVAQHCINCCEEALARGYSKKVALACLLHDASEAYIGDITRPLKKNLHKYLEIEDVLQGAIYIKYLGEDLTKEEIEQITSVDDTLLYYEFKHYMNETIKVPHSQLMSRPEFKFVEFKLIKETYKSLFNQLIIN